jgi:hypothetical protein
VTEIHRERLGLDLFGRLEFSRETVELRLRARDQDNVEALGSKL